MRRCVKLLAIAALLLLPVMISACNTVEGAGKDTKAAGQGIQNAADANK